MLPKNERASGQLAAKIAWESGFGSMTSDQICADLYKHAVEFNVDIFPLYRSISIECDQETLPSSLQFIPLIFTEQKFEKASFEKVIAKKRKCLSEAKKSAPSIDLEETSFILNAQEEKGLNSLTLEDLDNISFATVSNFFKTSFCNPADFICVVVGNFEVEKITPLLEKTLGAIPANDKGFQSLITTKQCIFPKKTLTQVIPLKCLSKSLNFLTFPIQAKINPASVNQLQLCCHIIEFRMRNRFKDRFKCMEGIQAAYQFPYFPYLESPWLTLQFCSDFSQCGNITEHMIKELKSLQTSGPTYEEIQFALKKYSRQNDREKKSNTYWLTSLANDGLMGWDPREKEKLSISATPESMKLIFAESFNFSQHTRLTTEPK